MYSPQISLIVACYNQAQYLDECLQSVLDQTYTDWECIIVNDGSPDNADEIVKKWLEKDTRFKYLKKENGGISSARNAGIGAAVGIYILPLDADDKISSNFLDVAYNTIHLSNEIVLVKSRVQEFGNRNEVWPSGYSFDTLIYQNQISCTALYRKVDWAKNNFYDINLWGYEDWEFWINLLKRGGKVVTVDTIILYYRIKSSSLNQEIKKNELKRKRLKNYIAFKHAELYEYDTISANHIFASKINRFLLKVTAKFLKRNFGQK